MSLMWKRAALEREQKRASLIAHALVRENAKRVIEERLRKDREEDDRLTRDAEEWLEDRRV